MFYPGIYSTHFHALIIFFIFFYSLSFTPILSCLFYCLPLTLLSSDSPHLSSPRWLQLFTVHFLARRLLSAARAILSPYNAVFSLTLIKVHLASKCCGSLNTDCTEKRKLKRQSKLQRHREREAEKENDRQRGHHVDKGRRNNGLMVIEDGQNNHCSPLTRLSIGLI